MTRPSLFSLAFAVAILAPTLPSALHAADPATTRPTPDQSTPLVQTAPASQATTGKAVPPLQSDPAERMEFVCQELDISVALHFVSLQCKQDIVVSNAVKGTVTVKLHQVTLEELLPALLEPHGWGHIRKGNIIYVYTKEELEKLKKESK